MTQDGVSKDDVKVPEGELGKQIQEDFESGKDLLVTIISAMGEEQVSFPSYCALPTSVVFFALICVLSGHLCQGGPQGELVVRATLAVT